MLALLLLLLRAPQASPEPAPPPADLAAVGVVVSGGLAPSVALLRSGGRTRVAAVGERVFGGVVAEIGPAGVAVAYGSTRVELRLAGTPAPAPRPAAAEAPAPLGREMSRAEVEKRIGEEAPRILAETTLTPVSEGGQVAGFALTKMPDSGLLRDAGLRPGDVIVSINDVPVDSMATLISLWPRLRNESQVSAQVLRNGQPVTLSLTLR